MKLIFISLVIAVSSGCANTYVPKPGSETSSKLEFELLTSSGPGGGGLMIGMGEECKANEVISRMSLGHHFQRDKNRFDTWIPTNNPITLKASIADTILYFCDESVVFTPQHGKNYFATFSYHLPGCDLSVFEIDSNGVRKLVQARICP